MAYFCDICAGEVEGGQSRCDDCQREMTEQLARMGITAQPQAVAGTETEVDKRLIGMLGDARLAGMIEDLVTIAMKARELPAVDRQDVSMVVKRLARAQGVPTTRDLLIELAATALAFANRLPPREGRDARGRYVVRAA